MKIHFKTQGAFMDLAKKCAMTIGFVTVVAVAGAAQTNTFPDNGNVGVGTTSPVQTIDVQSTEGSTQIKSTTGTNRAFVVTVNNGGSVIMGSESSAGQGLFNVGTLPYAGVFGTTGARPVQFATNQAARMTIDSTGNVGIGTMNPGGRLHIYGSSGNDMFVGTYGNTLNFLHDHNADDVSGWVNYVGYQGGTTKFRDFTIGNGKNAAIAFFDGSSGNVGIGASNPAVQFHLLNASTAQARIESTGSAAAVIDFKNPSRRWIVGTGTVSGGGDFSVYDANAGATIMHFNTSGNVGIGTVTPQYKLDVAGNINSNATITGNNIVAKYQDVAEWVPSSEQLSAGTVVVLDPTKSNQVISSTVRYDTRVAGVISAQPGITLGEGGDGKVLVATTGRVRVKVDASRGPIQIGDLLVTSNVPGMAMKSEPVNLGGVQIHRPGTIIGKALEPLAKGSGEILVLLSLQ